MARQPLTLTWAAAADDRQFLEAMAQDIAGERNCRKRAQLILAMLNGAEVAPAAAAAGMTMPTARKTVEKYNLYGWRALLTVQAPRGGDFLARYDQGYWAERVAKTCLDKSRLYRAIPYGTSRSEPFIDLETFREYSINEFLLQAWSVDGRWKRPDLLTIPRQFLRQQKGNDQWTPDLQHWDNDECQAFVKQATAAIEVETSLWQAKIATVPLSFTVKREDLESLRSWVRRAEIPLFIVQVFFDQAYVLPFAMLEYLVSLPRKHSRHVLAELDPYTNKPTYKVPLQEGVLLGNIPEPEVEGRVFKAPNGRVTVYGRLTGSAIEVVSADLLEDLASGALKGP
jgi:hypothetical protein